MTKKKTKKEVKVHRASSEDMEMADKHFAKNVEHTKEEMKVKKELKKSKVDDFTPDQKEEFILRNVDTTLEEIKGNNQHAKLTVRVNETLYKKLVTACKIDNKMSFQKFMIFAMEYCIENKIFPGGKNE